MSDYPISEDDSRPAAAPLAVRGRKSRFDDRFTLPGDEVSEHHFDWDSAELVAPGGLSPARQLAMQRQQERLSSMTRKPVEDAAR